jgi:cell division protein ZapE
MGPIIDGYQKRLAERELEADAAQSALAVRLDALLRELMQRSQKRSVFSRLFGKEPASPKGLYIWGSVGRGKTMLMDLFFEETPFEPKQRAHFHEFMADVHEHIAMARTNVAGDPIPRVAQGIAKEARLLCFDELHVTDIADAMILARLFEALFAAGTIVVATSNEPPSGLYKHGLNRQLFLPFIGLVSSHMDVVELKAQKDFRLDKLAGAQLYFSPADAAAGAALDKHWERLTGRHPGKSHALDVKGRKVHVPLASMGVARFHFDDLCAQPLGANDYLHIAHAFHTVIIDDIPLLTPDRRDVVRRFINLVDALYDSRICLIASTAAEPNALYPKGHGSDHFKRTASRLTEMRSEAYLAGHSGGRARR